MLFDTCGIVAVERFAVAFCRSMDPYTAVAGVLLSVVPPREGSSAEKWLEHSETLFAETGVFLTPAQCKDVYFFLINQSQGRDVAAGLSSTSVLKATVAQPALPSPVPTTAHNLLHLCAIVDSLYGAAVFQAPVPPVTVMTHNGAALGPYRDVVRSPMDLSLVRQRTLRKKLDTVADLEAHLVHIGANCVMFNAPEGEYVSTARDFVRLSVKEIRQAGA